MHRGSSFPRKRRVLYGVETVHGHYKSNEAVCQENETKRQKKQTKIHDFHEQY